MNVSCQQNAEEVSRVGVDSSSQGLYYRDGKLYALLSCHINPTTRAGTGLEYWEKSLGAGGWRQLRCFPGLERRLFSIQQVLPAYWGSSLVWIDIKRMLVLTCNDMYPIATKRVLYRRCGR